MVEEEKTVQCLTTKVQTHTYAFSLTIILPVFWNIGDQSLGETWIPKVPWKILPGRNFREARFQPCTMSQVR